MKSCVNPTAGAVTASSRRQAVEPAATRRGAVLVAAVVCLLIATSLLASMLKSVVRHARQTRQTEMRVQTEWLAESGLERAVWLMRTEQEYAGEVWRIPPEKLSDRYAGHVRIGLEPSADDASQILITATAVCTTEGNQRVQRTRRRLVPRVEPKERAR